MFFIPFDHQVELNAAQFETFQINEYGVSEEPVYQDSIFYVFSRFIDEHSSCLPPGSTQTMYTITRLHKEDLDLPIGKAACLDTARCHALMIQEDGSSKRPELSDFTFTIKKIPNSKLYNVTKSVK